MSSPLSKLGLKCISVLGLAAFAYAGCVDSAPSKPKAAGKAGAGVGGSAGKSSGGKAGAGGSAAKGGNGNSSGGADNGGGGQESGGAPGSGATGGASGHGGKGASGGRGGSTGKGGSSASSGAGGASGDDSGGAAGSDSAGSGGTSGSGGKGGAGGKAGTGGTGGGQCGALDQACCAADTCDSDLACLGGVNCSCIEAARSEYVLRADGVVLFESETAGELAVRNADTGDAMPGFVEVAGGGNAGCGVRSDHTLWCWATNVAGNLNGQLGNGTVGGSADVMKATQVLSDPHVPLTGVAGLANVPTDGTTSCAFTTGGNLYCWGRLDWITAAGTINQSSGYATLITKNGIDPLANVVGASVTYGGACAVVAGSSSHEVWCWGANDEYELAQADTNPREFPVKVSGLSDPTAVFTTVSNNLGWHAACALDGGKVRCWGYNASGAAGGASSAANVPTPTAITLASGSTELGGVTAVSAGNSTFCAMRDNGTIWCWGWRNAVVTQATNYGVTRVVGLGNPEEPRFLSSDGVYHFGIYPTTPTCGAL
jgi:hypothetical protein